LLWVAKADILCMLCISHPATLLVTVMGVVAGSARGDLVRIDFDGRDERFITEGTLLDRQYQGLLGSPRFAGGASDALTRSTIERYMAANPNLYRGLIASNPDLRTSIDHVGGGVSIARDGYVLRSMPGFLAEDGEPVISMVFDRPMAFASVTFAGDSTGASAILLFRQDRLVAIDRPRATPTWTQDTARYFALPSIGDSALFDTLVIIPGSSRDYTAITQISWAAPVVPAPGTAAIMTLTSAVLLRRSRR
jgi:hypothetical protein